MNWGRFALAVLSATVGTSLTDWFFFGVLFHGRNATYPEVWRDPPGTPETRKIIYSTLLTALTSAAFVFVCVRLGLGTATVTLKLAFAVWFIASLPLVITNALWMKLDRAVAVAHALGWLAKLIVFALAIVLLKP
jgi:hypothetical protein